MLKRSWLSVLVAVLVLAPPASATTRYASPTGTDTLSSCTAVEPPCSLRRAIETVAANGDLVLVDAGDYSLTSPVSPGGGKRLEIRGAGATQPRIVSSAAFALRLGPSGGLVSNLRLEAPGSVVDTAGTANPAVLERLTVLAGAASGGTAVRLTEGWLLRDSFVRTAAHTASSSNEGVAVQGTNGTSRAVNVTAVATDPTGVAIQAYAAIGGICVPPFRAELNATNVIARGGKHDASSPSLCTDGAQVLNLGHSNYRLSKVNEAPPVSRVEDQGGGQEADPLLAGAFDFHELAGSATIDAGAATSLLGSADLDGHPRTLGAAPDIGGDEFQPPPPVPAPTDTTAPVASLLGLKPALFRVPRSRRRTATRISYALTENANVEFGFERAVRRRKRTRWVRLGGSLARAGAVGGNRFRFGGRLDGMRLAPGTYRLSAVPTDVAGNRGRAVRAKFRIRR